MGTFHIRKPMPRGWAKIRLQILERDCYLCGICGLPGANSVDHIVPRFKGGTEDAWNLRAAHLKCNVKRHIKWGPPPRRSRF
jgi:5-methylcytosine-specific restriction endonuclease McrA